MNEERRRITGRKIHDTSCFTIPIIEEEQPKTKPKLVSIPLVILLAIVLSGASGAAGAYFIINNYTNNVTTENGIATSTTPLNETNSISTAVSKVYDATVVVEVFNKEKKLVSTGTGFIYKKEKGKAYLMTNNHVINGGDSIKISFTDGTELDATIVGADTYSDIAVLSVKDSNKIVAATLGES